MKSILITGAGSYIGVSLENDLKQWPESYRVDSLDMRGSDWESRSFRGYDAVFHVAGLVHQPDSKNDPARSDLYDQVNHILAVRTAEKAKADGVGQFLFMSSESVYGLTAPIGKTVVITKDTPLHPADNYGVNWIAHANGKGILMVRGFTWALKLLRFASPAVDKAFGSLCYDSALSAYSRDYCVKTLEQSILETETI